MKHPPARPTPHGPAPPHAALALEQVEELTRQQQRILHRPVLIDYVLAGGQALTMGEALADLLADIIDAARAIGTMLQQAGNGTPNTAS